MGRNLVVCCDGTWNTPQQKDRGRNVPSNVVKMARAVEDAADQPVYYDTGVGTRHGLDRWTGGLLGLGLTGNIKQAYAWIAGQHRPDDRVFLFGFSRGAYTVRSLAGMIGRCGLSSSGRAEVDQAYELYRKASDDAGRRRAEGFKAKQRDIGIHFMGVWDTVGSLGVPALTRYGLLRKTVRLLTDGSALAHGFHDETLGRHVRHAFHALSIDERRGAFKPSLWKSTGEPRPGVEQAWFAGVHCNVGGGYSDCGLSDHAFMWMAAKAMQAGLRLDRQYLAMRVDPNAHGEMRDEFVGLYQLLPRHVRAIGMPATLNEKIHASVFKRLGHPTNDYAPGNLPADAGERVTDEGVALVEALREAVHGPARDGITASNRDPLPVA
ncbi:DUF2235 domain-containing protein [Ramlibacter sp.]|uniref:DUF2235 domain-containing protein n=1 Tax=Ramlibacter sp. TaxID=1917967 RepID=UPI002FC79506